MKSLHRVISSHDVRSIICADHMLFSGGVDTYLTLHQYPAYKTTISIPPSLPCSTGVKVARDARCLLLTYSQSLQLWRRGRSSLSLGGGCRSLLRAPGPLLACAVDLEVGHELLLLREHRLERVQLGLQLLNGYLGLTLRGSRILNVRWISTS